MKKKRKRGLSLIVTSLMIIVLVLIGISIIWLTMRNVLTGGIKTEIMKTGLGVSEKGIIFTEDMETSNPETIDKSSGANNFVKYCFGITIIILATGYVIRQIYKGKRLNK